MAADILHNIAVLRGQIAAEAAGDPSLLRFAAQRGSDLSDMGEAGCAAAAEWQPRGSSRTSSGSSGSFDDDSVRRARVRALRDDAAYRRRRDTLGGYPLPRPPPPPPQPVRSPRQSPVVLTRVAARPGPTRQAVIGHPEPGSLTVSGFGSGPGGHHRLHGLQGLQVPQEQRGVGMWRHGGGLSGMGFRSGSGRLADYELVEQDERELDEGEVSDDPSSSMLSQILGSLR